MTVEVHETRGGVNRRLHAMPNLLPLLNGCLKIHSCHTKAEGAVGGGGVQRAGDLEGALL